MLASNGKPKNNISDQHPFLGKGDSAYAEWEPILWGLGHRGVVPGSDPQDKVYYPSLMHRGVTFNNRLGWTRYSPCLLYTSPSPRDGLLSRMPSSA